MKNPFSFSGIVQGAAFCNRTKEINDLKRYIENSENILLYSHRRFGKTTLINKVFSEVRNVTPIYIDLYGTTRVEDFITALFKGISAAETKIEKLMKLVKEKISCLTVNFSIDLHTGAPVAVPVFAAVDKTPAVEEVFQLLAALSQKRKAVVAFDEFQEISKYGKDVFERQLRKRIQWHERIAYIFSGSQKHLLSEMFSDSKRAFYKLAASYPLKKIETRHYLVWIQGLYQADGRRINPTAVENVVARCENHPMYVQEFFYYLWDDPAFGQGEFPTKVLMERIDRVACDIIQRRETEFINIWESLTLNQRKTLRLIVATAGQSIFSADNLSKAGLKSPSQVTKAVEVLVKREVIAKNAVYALQDPIFRRWIQEMPGLPV